MKEEKLDLKIVLRVGLSLMPILFGMSLPAMVWCAFNLAMSFIVFGPKTFVVSSLSAVCVSMFFCSAFGKAAMTEGLFIALEAILCAFACIYTVVRRKDFFSGLWMCAGGFLIPGFMSVRYNAMKSGRSIVQFLVKEPISFAKEQIFAVMKEAKLDIDMSLIETVFNETGKVVEMIVPAVFVIMSIFVGYIVMWCVCSKLRALPIKVEHSFSEIKIPRTMLAVAAVSLALCLLNINKNVTFVSLNVLVVLLYMNAFSGISFVDFYLRKLIKSVLLRIIIYCVVFYTLAALPLAGFIVLAAVDSFFDFRGIEKRRQNRETEKREA